MSLERIADKLRQRYTLRRREKYSQYVCDERRYDTAFWVSVASITKELGATPDSYVDLLFESWNPRSSDMPPPNLLKSDALIQNWKNKPKIDRVECESALANMFKLFASYLEAGIPATSVLMDSQLYFNPVFRYAMACRMNLLELKQQLEEPAKDYIQDHPIYLELLSQFLPEDFHV